jgi:hypothetical protein
MTKASFASPRPADQGGIDRRCRRISFLLVLAIMAIAASACSRPGSRLVRTDSDRITAQELSRLNVSNAYDAVLQLRPLWLRSRGRRSYRLPTEIVVAQNGSYFGPVASLRQFQIEDVRELRYLDGPQAGALLSGLGSRHVEAAIVVELR